MNGLHSRINTLSEAVIVTEKQVSLFLIKGLMICVHVSVVFCVHKSCTTSNFALNLGKTSVMKFAANNSVPYALSSGCNDKVSCILCKYKIPLCVN